MNSSPYIKAVLVLSVLSLFLPHPTYAQTLSLSPATQTINLNDTFDVQIVLNAEGKDTSGVDALFTFNNSLLNLTDIVHGSIYDTYIGENIDNANGQGTISGLASSSSTTFSGTGTVATLRFRAIDSGTAAVAFQYTPGNANDTNVAVLNVTGDALTNVSNGSYTISSTGASSTTTTTTTTTSNATNTSSDSLPVAGNSFPALILAMIGGFFMWLGTLLGREA